MTAPLRRAHGIVWLLFAIVLPALIVVALATRKDLTPRNAGLDWERLR